MINSTTDIKIFIEYNKSANLIVTKEKFEEYEDTSTALKVVGQGSAAAAMDSSKLSNVFILDENYMANTIGVAPEESKRPQHSRTRSQQIGSQIDSSNTFSAQAAYKQSKQYDGFEIIDDGNAKTRDRNLLEDQIRGLLNSVPIQIEEKGYLLQLMHDQDLRDCLTDIISEIN